MNKLVARMKAIWILLSWLFLLGVCSKGLSKNVTSRPAVVNVGAIFVLDSSIGRASKVAIEEAVEDVNSNSSILHGTKLVMTYQNSNCSGFLGMVSGSFLQLQ